jgi:hypothetical protein
MCLIHGNQRDTRRCKCVHEAWRPQTLRRHEKQPDPTAEHIVQHRTPLASGQHAGDEHRRDRGTSGSFGLVLHEQDQRAQHKCEPRQSQGGDLIAEALTATRRKYAERIPAGQRGTHQKLLAIPKDENPN